MVALRWETFKGSNLEVGRQLGRYWVERLKVCEKSVYGRSFLKKNPYTDWLSDRQWLGKSQNSKDYACFLSTFHREFPLLVEEIDGMVQGAKDAGYKAFFESMFDLCLGESGVGCSTIAHRGANGMILAHHEMEELRYPLCYARVRLYNKSENREFLTVSYPFQFFGSAIGANSTLAFTGNSIGMSAQREKEVWRSLERRVPKTVFSRLMLEQPRISGIKRLLDRYHSRLPAHWYIATRTTIVSAQVRPSIREDAAEQLKILPVHEETSCHTNHFKQGRSTSWSCDPEDCKESRDRLETLERFVGTFSNGSDQCASTNLQRILERVRKREKKYTSATIILHVGKSGTKVEAFDHFDGETVRVGMPAIVASG